MCIRDSSHSHRRSTRCPQLRESNIGDNEQPRLRQRVQQRTDKQQTWTGENKALTIQKQVACHRSKSHPIEKAGPQVYRTITSHRHQHRQHSYAKQRCPFAHPGINDGHCGVNAPVGSKKTKQGTGESDRYAHGRPRAVRCVLTPPPTFSLRFIPHLSRPFLAYRVREMLPRCAPSRPTF